jgi:hypothetical protein
MEQKQESEKSNSGVVERDIETSVGRESARELQRSIAVSTSGITNQQFIESKLTNCKKFVETISCLQQTTLLKQFLEYQVKDILEYVIWMTNSKRPIDIGLAELFAFHKLDINQLKKEEYERLRQYFICFQTVVQQSS